MEGRKITRSARISHKDGSFRASKPGEEGGVEYSVCGTGPVTIGAEFGLGLGLYFHVVQALGLLMVNGRA